MALRTKEQCWRGDVKLSLDFELEHNYLRIFGGSCGIPNLKSSQAAAEFVLSRTEICGSGEINLSSLENK